MTGEMIEADAAVAPQPPRKSSKRTKPCKMWEVALASLVGGVFLWLADVVMNGEKAITNRIAHEFGVRLAADLDSQLMETVVLVMLIGLGWGLCFVFRPITRPAAFARGCSVFAVLVGMNTGAQAFAAPANAAEMVHVENQAVVTWNTPRELGPLGLGTLITGKSAVVTEQVQVDGSATLPCTERREVAGETYCGVDRSDAGQIVIEWPETRSLIWVKEGN